MKVISEQEQITFLTKLVGDCEEEIVNSRLEIERLKAELAQYKAGQWQPVGRVRITCACSTGCGSQLLVDAPFIRMYDKVERIWVEISLPDGYAVCRCVQGDYVTVSREYLDKLLAAAPVPVSGSEEDKCL